MISIHLALAAACEELITQFGLEPVDRKLCNEPGNIDDGRCTWVNMDGSFRNTLEMNTGDARVEAVIEVFAETLLYPPGTQVDIDLLVEYNLDGAGIFYEGGSHTFDLDKPQQWRPVLAKYLEEAANFDADQNSDDESESDAA